MSMLVISEREYATEVTGVFQEWILLKTLHLEIL